MSVMRVFLLLATSIAFLSLGGCDRIFRWLWGSSTTPVTVNITITAR